MFVVSSGSTLSSEQPQPHPHPLNPPGPSYLSSTSVCTFVGTSSDLSPLRAKRPRLQSQHLLEHTMQSFDQHQILSPQSDPEHISFADHKHEG